jgi:corrinoid protein of di/trimethylamine methyltransferase
MPDNQVRGQVLAELAEAVVSLDEERAVAGAERALHEGVEPFAAIQEGLLAGMARAGQLFEEQEYFVPELLVASDALYAGLNVLRPHLRSEDLGTPGKVVIGVVEGDTHDIGKNLVRIILQTKGFEVHDLGRDVPPARFVEKAVEVGAEVVALSTLMTTTMVNMDETVNLLASRGLRDRVKVIVGGSPLSKAYADRIGADGYARDAIAAAELVRKLVARPAGGAEARAP